MAQLVEALHYKARKSQVRFQMGSLSPRVDPVCNTSTREVKAICA